MSPETHLLNPALLEFARNLVGRQKQAFVPSSDPSGGMGGAPAGGDPSGGMGGMPPPDAGGGAAAAAPPPADPRIDMLMQQVQQLTSASAAGGAGGAAGNKALTPKIDEKVVLSQILKLLARIADHLGIPIPASEMVVNQQDLSSLATASTSGSPMPGMDPNSAGAIPPIAPMAPMQGAGVPGAGVGKTASAGFGSINNKARTLAGLLKKQS
jgi:hypothetical protein